MSPDHGPRRGRVVPSDTAPKQVVTLGPAELSALDRAIIAISIAPGLGTYPKPIRVLQLARRTTADGYDAPVGRTTTYHHRWAVRMHKVRQ